MKHLYKILFFALVLTGCAKDEVILEDNPGDAVAFASGIEQDTKVSYSPESDAVRMSWTKGDAIGIYSVCADVPDAINTMYVADLSEEVSSFTFASPIHRIKWKVTRKATIFMPIIRTERGLEMILPL